MSQSTDPTTPAPVTVDDLIAAVHALDDARTQLSAAHVETATAAQTVTDETVSAQADIDTASAAYERRTTTAKQGLAAKQSAEDAAAAREDAAFADIEAKLAAFKPIAG
jgi:multidrug efflux pump subunit AcrA (membrane-fusion protein)